jgi:hypothetical protein
MRLLERCDEIVRIIDETLGDIDKTTSRSLTLNVVMDGSSEFATMSAETTDKRPGGWRLSL